MFVRRITSDTVSLLRSREALLWSTRHVSAAAAIPSTTPSDSDSTETEVPSTSKTRRSSPSPSKSKKRATQSSELLNYIAKLPSFQTRKNDLSSDSVSSKQSLGKHLKVQRNSPDSMYLVNSDIGTTLVKALQEPRLALDPQASVIEFNPKYGVLTSLLKSELGFQKINCFEDDIELGTELVKNYDVNLIPTNFLSFPRLFHLDKHDGGSRVTTILNKVERGKSKKLYIFGSTGVISLINFTVRSLVTQRVLFDDELIWKDDITFFLVLGPKPHKVITGSPDSLYTIYRPITVLFQLLFQHETLVSLPRKAFLPWETRDAGSMSVGTRAEIYRKNRIPHDPDQVFLIKFTPNTKVLEQVGRDHLVALWYFIRHHLYSRKTCVIPQLEQWIPGCGPRLIRQGFTIYTQFGSLTPPEILDVFLQFTSWPEYQSSSFLTAVEKFQTKMDSAYDDVLEFPRPT